ncbi:MAG: GGDEF domain-containing protein [Sulfurimonas sp.]|nr:GGDEF domain-containing protein [Sulfurimonas sp.]
MNLEKEKVVFISNQIADEIAINMSFNFNEAVEEVVTNTLSNTNILLINIYDNQTDENKNFSNNSLTLKMHKENNEIIHTQELIDPVVNEVIGELTIVYSNDNYEAYINSFNTWLLFGILAFTFSLALLIYLLYKSLKNLSILDNALKEFNPQNPQKLQLLNAHKDEVSSISNSANKMIEKIIEFLERTKKLNRDLHISQAHLKDAQRMARVGSFEYDAVSDKLKLSDEYYRILGLKMSIEFTWSNFLNLIAIDDAVRVKNAFHVALTNGSRFSIQHKFSLGANKEIYVLTKGKVRKKKDGSVKLTAISMDISNDVANKKTIEKLAYYDALTGLANRTLLKDRMLKALQSAKRREEKLGVIFLDLDHFKLINDTLGHSVGDELLIYVSNLLESQIRDSDTLARLGGDEFVILIPSITTNQDIEKFASKIRTIIRG